MKILFIRKNSQDLDAIFRKAEEKLKSLYKTLELIVWNCTDVKPMKADIARAEPDLLLTLDLSGFEQSTLTGGLAYNLLNCKQIHLLLRDNLPEESCLSKQLSIAMFFYCAGTEYYKRLWDTYPDIPYLKQLKNWNLENTPTAVNKNAGILCNVILEVAQICRIYT